MKNKNLLIGAGVLVVGYLLWKKSQSKVNQTQYSKECLDELERALQQEVVRPANFKKDFLERCQKLTNEANLQVKNKSNNLPTLMPKSGTRDLRIPVVISDLSILSNIPNEFTVKSNGSNTRYYKNIDKTLTGFAYSFSVPELYAHSHRTDGLIGGLPPIKISVRQFSDAYSQFLKQPK